MLGFLIGLIGGVGLFMGAWAFITKNKFIGIVDVILSIGAVASGLMVIDQKLRKEFDGSDWTYLWDSALQGGNFLAWLTIILFAAVILMSVVCFIKIRRAKRS